LFDENERKEVLARDPNIAGYETFHDSINPDHRLIPIVDDLLMFVSLVRTLMFTSTLEFKRTMVTGTSTRPKGVIFVGREVQPSHLMLRDYLDRKGYFTKTRDLILVDVHSGLGPKGNDTFLTSENVAGGERVFLNPKNTQGLAWIPPVGFELTTQKLGETKNDAAAGYDLVRGWVHGSYPKLFKNLQSPSIAFTEEFGTFPSLYVGYALVRENQAFQYGDEKQRLLDASRLKHVFCPDSHSFATLTMKRGLIVIMQALSA